MGISWKKKRQVLTMRSFIALCLVASVLRAKADVNVGVATVMCNCAAQVDTYNAYNSAVADCSAYNGAGAASCVANVLGHLSADGRSVDFTSLSGMYGDAAIKCASTGAVEAANFVGTDAWSWPGSFDFNALDAALSDFFACANSAAVNACEDSLSDQLNSCLAA